MESVKKCLHCNKKLRPINTGERHYHNDWKSRKYHKSCYKQILEDDRINDIQLLLLKSFQN